MRTTGDIGKIGFETALSLCNGGQGRTAVITGANWIVETNGYEAYPPGLVSSEGKIYGVFRLKHRISGVRIQIVTGTVESEKTGTKRADQIHYLLARGKELAKNYPTFVGGDFNYESGEASDKGVGGQIANDMASGARRLSFWNPCNLLLTASPTAYQFDTGGVIHMVLFDHPGKPPLELRSYVLDPAHTDRPLNQPASQIQLPGLRHVMIGARFQIGP